jgi:ferredoxin-NADP reductase
VTEQALPALAPVDAGSGPTAAQPPTRWQRCTVRGVAKMSPTIVMLRLEVSDRIDHLPGQHYVVRLTADDGYTASRSYSIASAPSDELVELCIERLDDGEVSGYLYDVVQPGDELEVRGPIGGWFVWDGQRPAAAIGGGTGVVPLLAMLRHARATGAGGLLKVAASGRSIADLPYHSELISFGAVVALTRQPADGFLHHRLGPDDLRWIVSEAATTYICGSATFAEAMSRIVVGLGVTTEHIRVERFGPT